MSTHPAFAIVVTAPHFCVDTDAYQGTVTWVDSRHLTRPQAEAALAEMFGEDYEGEFDAKVELRPYREGEDDRSWKGPSLLELYYHDAAQSNYSDEERYLDDVFSAQLASLSN